MRNKWNTAQTMEIEKKKIHVDLIEKICAQASEKCLERVHADERNGIQNR